MKQAHSLNHHLSSIIQEEIKNVLNENTKIQIGQGTYGVHGLVYRKGAAVTFLPDSKTLDIPKNTQVVAIQNALKKLGEVSKYMYFESGHDAAGLVFRLDISSFTDSIINTLRK